jgi:hypothetical protein
MTRSRSPLLAVLALLALVAPVLASSVTPKVVDSADSCGPLTPGTVEFLVDASNLVDGTVSKGKFEATIDLVGTIETGSISFSNASLPVKAAFVAGADSGNLYEYPKPVTADDGLVAPEHQPITSVSFCYVTNDSSGSGGDTAGGGSNAGPTAPGTDTVAVTPAAEPSGPIVLVAFAAFAILMTALLTVLIGRLHPVPSRAQRGPRR